MSYDSYGNVLSDTNPGFAIPFGFAGGLLDGDTGLIRFGFMDYEPSIGRWTARDPIGLSGGLNVYGYVHNSPAQFVDLFGLSRADIDAATEKVARDNPDLNVDKRTGTMNMIGNGDGFTNPITKQVSVNKDYLRDNLTPQEKLNLERVIIHENLHRNGSRLDMILRPFNHPDIYEEAKRRHEDANRTCYRY